MIAITQLNQFTVDGKPFNSLAAAFAESSQPQELENEILRYEGALLQKVAAAPKDGASLELLERIKAAAVENDATAVLSAIDDHESEQRQKELSEIDQRIAELQAKRAELAK